MNHREIKFRGKALEDFETSIDGVQKWDWVEGYYYFCRSRMCGIIVTTLCEESGGVGSGLVQLEIKVDYKTVCQYTGFKDKHGTEIYCGDIIKIRVIRQRDNRRENINHSKGEQIFYLNAIVTDIRGNLKYNRGAIEALEKPIGKERIRQYVMCDRNIFDCYSCLYTKRKTDDSDWIRYKKEEDPCENIKRFKDLEIIGNKFDNDLLNL